MVALFDLVSLVLFSIFSDKNGTYKLLHSGHPWNVSKICNIFFLVGGGGGKKCSEEESEGGWEVFSEGGRYKCHGWRSRPTVTCRRAGRWETHSKDKYKDNLIAIQRQ